MCKRHTTVNLLIKSHACRPKKRASEKQKKMVFCCLGLVIVHFFEASHDNLSILPPNDAQFVHFYYPYAQFSTHTNFGHGADLANHSDLINDSPVPKKTKCFLDIAYQMWFEKWRVRKKDDVYLGSGFFLNEIGSHRNVFICLHLILASKQAINFALESELVWVLDCVWMSQFTTIRPLALSFVLLLLLLLFLSFS